MIKNYLHNKYETRGGDISEPKCTAFLTYLVHCIKKQFFGHIAVFILNFGSFDQVPSLKYIASLGDALSFSCYNRAPSAEKLIEFCCFD